MRRADHSSRGVLPTVVRRCVWSRNLKNEEAMVRVGPQRHRKQIIVNKWLDFITKTECVYCAVQTGCSVIIIIIRLILVLGLINFTLGYPCVRQCILFLLQLLFYCFGSALRPLVGGIWDAMISYKQRKHFAVCHSTQCVNVRSTGRRNVKWHNEVKHMKQQSFRLYKMYILKP